MILKISGKDIAGLENEAGGHRIQRVPPTERKGRTHTSTVTVAVMDDNPSISIEINQCDLDINWFSGTGPGGQNRNKVMASCRVRHIPTGTVATAQTRSRITSLSQAIETLKTKIVELSTVNNSNNLKSIRRDQIGTGRRGNKIRTIQFQNDTAIDHITNKRITAEEYMKGMMYKLWPNHK